MPSRSSAKKTAQSNSDSKQAQNDTGTIPDKYLQRLAPLAGKTIVVTGGAGFVGRHMVELLLEVGCTVRVFDISTRTYLDDNPNLSFVVGNLIKQEDVEGVLTGAFGVIHVASPSPLCNNEKLFMMVNVDGTNMLLKCCKALGVKRFVYTSSASIMFDGTDQANFDENSPLPVVPLDSYTKSKLIAEKNVLKASDNHSLFTCAMRPHGIFGPGDVHFFPNLGKAAQAGKHKWIIGPGTNIVDFTYVTNVVYSHLLGLVELGVDADINGQAYFITNNSPVNMWAWLGMIYQHWGYDQPYLNLPTGLMLFAGWACDQIASRVKSFKPTFSLQRVRYLTVDHYYSSDKAKRDFGYEPAIEMEEAVRRTIAAFPHLRHPDFKDPKKPLVVSKRTDKGSNPVTALAAFVLGLCALYYLVLGVPTWDTGFTHALVVAGLIAVNRYLKIVHRRPCTETPDLSGKMALITGGNRGIGKVTVKRLVKLNCDVILASRSKARGEAAKAEILKQVPDGGNITVVGLDLSDMKNTYTCLHEVVKVLEAKDKQLDFLINNAGAAVEPSLTKDGFNQSYQTNYVGHFALTNGLLDAEMLAEKARIINVSSTVHSQGEVNLTELTKAQPTDALNTHSAYQNSKLANVLFSNELQRRRLAGSGKVSISLHPGIIATDFPLNYIPQWLYTLVKPIFFLIACSVEAGAQTTLFAALSPTLARTGGIYLSDSKITKPASQATDVIKAAQLWDKTAALLHKEHESKFSF